MYKMTCISNVFFMLFSFCLGTEVWYTVIPDKTWDNTSPLKEEVSKSLDRCAVLCKSTTDCAAANYNQQTRTCEMLELSKAHLMSLKDDHSNSAIIKEAEGLIAFWPLTQDSQGKNRVPGGTDLQLHGVEFPGDPGPWKSTPAKLTGSASSYAIGTGTDLLITKDVSFMAAVYLDQWVDGPLIDSHAIGDWGPHFWLYGNRLYLAFTYPSCDWVSLWYTTEITHNQWVTVAGSFDYTAKVISLWVDGQLQTGAAGACSENTKCETTMNVGKGAHGNDAGRYYDGKVTCMSVYTKAVSYEHMYHNTMPFCLA